VAVLAQDILAVQPLCVLPGIRCLRCFCGCSGNPRTRSDSQKVTGTLGRYKGKVVEPVVQQQTAQLLTAVEPVG
jgi:hypothetical protein